MPNEAPQIEKRKASPAEVVGYVADKRINSRVRTSIPGVVQSYDVATQRADVKIAINRLQEDGSYEEDPVLLNLPVLFPQSNSHVLHFPLTQNDPVLVTFCERSIDEFLVADEVGTGFEPVDPRRFDEDDAVAYAGISIDNQPIPSAMAKADALTIGARDGSNRLELKDDGSVALGTNSVSLDLTSSNQVRLGNATENLVTQLKDLAGVLNNTLTQIQAITVTTALGPQPIINLAAFTTIQTQLATLTARISSIEG